MGVIKERYAVCSRYRGSELRDANGKSYNHNKTAELQGWGPQTSLGRSFSLNKATTN